MWTRASHAYAALAEAYRLREIWGGAGIGAFAEESRSAAARALNLDAKLPEAHMPMAIVLSQSDWNWVAAESEFRLAIEGRPSLQMLMPNTPSTSGSGAALKRRSRPPVVPPRWILSPPTI